jgi:hypothetical protein
MFTVVGLIGMVGIVINDSIVLVTTIDEYAKDRGLVPAIIDGTSDRLRPVLLTTLTTVLGLAPLLYEGSNQAEFLKPTVVTLVFGLAFGMFLVLLIVPSLMAMQADVTKQVRAARRALKGRKTAMALPAGLAAVGALALFGALVVPVGLNGAPLPALAAALPMLNGGLGIAMALFLGAVMALLLVIYVISAIVFGINRRAA